MKLFDHVPSVILSNTVSSSSTGILEREQEQSVVYGSVDFGKTVVTCDKYRDLVGRHSRDVRFYRYYGVIYQCQGSYRCPNVLEF